MTKRELLQELWAMEKSEPTKQVQQPADLLPVLDKYSRRKVEHFIVVTLDGAHKIIRARVITKGLVNKTIVHAREVYRHAIMDNATAIIVAHNHPSGSLEPSEEDTQITKVLKSAGEVIGIGLLDHLILSKAGYYSFLEAGYL